MKTKRCYFIIYATFALASCGGISSGNGDTEAPVIASTKVNAITGGKILVAAIATDNTAVTAYCFKAGLTTPVASDSCFQAEASQYFALPQADVIYVWSRDAAGNISVPEPVGCLAPGINASRASTLPTVCVSTSLGQFVLELESAKAPITVANFLKYVNDGYYSQTVFHRVISNFIVQGGGYTAVPISATNTKAGMTYPSIALEPTSKTGLSNNAGTVAMARTNVLDSATNQFFINVVDNMALNSNGGGYAVFGRVISGMDSTIQNIRNVTVQSSGNEVSQPTIPPVITWAYQIK